MIVRHNKTRRTWALWENMVLAFENLRDRAYRSLLTATGVLIGVVIIIGVASVLNGFRQRTVDNISALGANSITVSKWPMISLTNPGADIRKRKELTLADAWAIRDGCPAVATVSPFLTENPRSAKFEGKEMLLPTLMGVFAEARDARNLELAAGRFFTADELRYRAQVCVIGWKASQTLFPRRQAIDKSVVIDGHRFHVIGALEKFKAAGSADDESDEDAIIYVPYPLVHALYPWNKEIQIVAQARPGQLPQALEQIEEALRLHRHVPWTKPNDFELNTANSLVAAFDKIVFATLAVMFALSSVAFLVGGVGVMNVMFASVKERTREIGVRRAIGARRRDIVWQFLVEAIAMTGAGGLLGVALGEALMRAVMEFLPKVPCATPMWARVFGLFGSMSVGLIFGLWPAISAARLDPIKALRYE